MKTSEKEEKELDVKVPSTRLDFTKPKGKGRSRSRGRGKDVSKSTAIGSVPKGLGIIQPKFLAANVSEEEAYLPIGFAFGNFRPTGRENFGTYSDYGTAYCQSVLVKLKKLGYPPTYTVGDIRTYFNNVADVMQTIQYISQIRGIGDHVDVHTSRVIQAWVAAGINGRLVASQRSAIKSLSAVPYPDQFSKILENDLSCTLLSDNPNSQMRLFAPTSLKRVPEDGVNQILTANYVYEALQQATDTLFGNATNMELASILPEKGITVSEKLSGPVKFNGNVVNNILNLPYSDLSYEPIADADTATGLYFRRQLNTGGCLTFAPDPGFVLAPNFTVWETFADVSDNRNPMVSLE